jgi:hypothetical protein
MRFRLGIPPKTGIAKFELRQAGYGGGVLVNCKRSIWLDRQT